MAKRISEKEKREIIDDFIKNKSLDEISKKFNFTKLTIKRHLKIILGDEKFNQINQLSKSKKDYSNLIDKENKKVLHNNNNEQSEELKQDSSQENIFLEIAPLNLEIDDLPQKDLSSFPINDVVLPKVVYMIVNKQVELETKRLKEYVDWNFLSEEDLSRNTIEIFDDLKVAKRSSKKDQRVIKVPNSDVFKITAPILKLRGISRIVSSEVLIAL